MIFTTRKPLLISSCLFRIGCIFALNSCKTLLLRKLFPVIILLLAGFYFFDEKSVFPTQKTKTELKPENEQPKGKSAKVVRISDGDTLGVLVDGKEIKIRLAHIDAPEKGQPFGAASKKALSDLCFGKTILVDSTDTDRYGRVVAVLYDSAGKNINKEMVKQGMAWHFKRYSRDNSYSKAEAAARQKKIGLWQDSKPVPPWEWRKQSKKK